MRLLSRTIPLLVVAFKMLCSAEEYGRCINNAELDSNNVSICSETNCQPSESADSKAACDKNEQVLIPHSILHRIENKDEISLPDKLRPIISDPIQLAQHYYEVGMNYARQGDYKLALAYLRGACRLNNTSALFWNDLGVTEMRMGLYQKAKLRFLSALAIEEGFNTARDNLNDIRSYLSKADYSKGIRKYRQQHYRGTPRSIQLEDLMAATYLNDSILFEPFIIRNAASLLFWDLRAFSLHNLTRYGGSKVDFYPHNMAEEQVHPYFTSLNDGLRQVLSYPEGVYDTVDASLPGTYLQWNMNKVMWDAVLTAANATLPVVLTDRHWMPECLENLDIINDFQLKTHWKMLLIGEAHAGMFNHKDTLKTSSWQIQVRGRKRWHLCSPLDDHRMYKAGNVDAFEPDYSEYPKFRHVKNCYDFFLEPGDLLYYPAEYWHQTKNLDTPTISITGTVVTSHNYHGITEQLRKECEGRGSIFARDNRLCNRLALCFETMNRIYQIA